MATVTVTQTPKPTQYEPAIRVEYNGSSSLIAQVGWNNPETMAALTKLFHLKPNEYLAAIVVSEIGIKAEIGSL